MDAATAWSVPTRHRLRSAGEHLNEIVVEAVVELTLEAPLELRMFQIARMQVEVIGVHGNGRIAKLNDDLDDVAVLARGEIQQRVLVPGQCFLNASERIEGHTNILSK